MTILLMFQDIFERSHFEETIECNESNMEEKVKDYYSRTAVKVDDTMECDFLLQDCDFNKAQVIKQLALLLERLDIGEVL